MKLHRTSSLPACERYVARSLLVFTLLKNLFRAGGTAGAWAWAKGLWTGPLHNKGSLGDMAGAQDPRFCPLDCEGWKPQEFLCSVRPQRCQLELLFYYLVVALRFIYLKDLDVCCGKPGLEQVRQCGVTVWVWGVKLGKVLRPSSGAPSVTDSVGSGWSGREISLTSRSWCSTQ